MIHFLGYFFPTLKQKDPLGMSSGTGVFGRSHTGNKELPTLNRLVSRMTDLQSRFHREHSVQEPLIVLPGIGSLHCILPAASPAKLADCHIRYQQSLGTTDWRLQSNVYKGVSAFGCPHRASYLCSRPSHPFPCAFFSHSDISSQMGGRLGRI